MSDDEPAALLGEELLGEALELLPGVEELEPLEDDDLSLEELGVDEEPEADELGLLLGELDIEPEPDEDEDGDDEDEPGDDSEPLEDLEPEAPVLEVPARSQP